MASHPNSLRTSALDIWYNFFGGSSTYVKPPRGMRTVRADSDSESRRRSEWGNHSGKPSDSDYLPPLYAPALMNKGHSLCRLSESASETESACTVHVPSDRRAGFRGEILTGYFRVWMSTMQWRGRRWRGAGGYTTGAATMGVRVQGAAKWRTQRIL